MKKFILAIVLFFGGVNSLWAGEEIPMQIIDPSPGNGGNTLAPPRPWYDGTCYSVKISVE